MYNKVYKNKNNKNRKENKYISNIPIENNNKRILSKDYIQTFTNDSINSICNSDNINNFYCGGIF